MTMSGLAGSFDLTNIPLKYKKMIELASYIHIGKGTTFGLGKFDYKIY